jgi:large subunit ribosomal protein L7/L12
MNEKLTNIIEQLKTLSLLEAIKLVKEMEKIFDINTTKNEINNITLSETTLQNQISEKEEEKISFNVFLSDVPSDKKIAILKIVRTITGLGLKESKEIVDNPPKLLKENITREEVDTIRNEIETVGGKIFIK